MIILPRQTTPYTCGPACLIAVNRLVASGTYYENDLAEELGALPGIGVDHDDLKNWLLKHNLPVTVEGTDTYEGGVAIANIKNPFSHIGHFVIMLGVRDGVYRYYCPLYGSVFEKREGTGLDEFIWENMDGSLKRWSVSLACDTDYYDEPIEAEQHVFILGDSKDTLQPEYDTSLLLLEAYRKSGQSVSWATPDEIYTRARMLHLSGIPVLNNDIVWVRTDPVNTVYYYEMLRRIGHMDAHMLNHPHAIVSLHDKLTTLFFEEENFCTASNRDTVRRALRHLKVKGKTAFVVKSPSLFGGKNVVLCESEEAVYEAFEELIADSNYVIIQGYISTGERQKDCRVVVTPDKIIGSMNRVAEEGGFLCNIHAGASVEAADGLSDEQKAIIAEIQDFMDDNDLFMVGIDFLGDIPIEVNVTCPSGIPQLNEVYGKALEYELIEEAWSYTGTHEFRTHLPVKE